MKSIQFNKIFWGAIVCLNAFFLVYYVGLAVNMRLHYDDIHWLYSAQVQNLWEYLDWVWYDRSGRMTVYAMNWIFSTITLKVGVYWFWPMLYMLFGWGLCWIFVRELPLPIANWKKSALFVLVYNLYILTAVDFAVFYWPCAMQYYIIGPATLAIVGYAIRKELKWYQWAFAIFVVCLVAFGYEYWIRLALMILFFIGLYYWYMHHWNIKQTWAQPQVRRVVLFAIFLIVGFIITSSAPGVSKRVDEGAAYEGMVHPDNMLSMCVAYAKSLGTLLYFQAFYLPYYLILALAMIYVSVKADSRIKNAGLVFKWMTIIIASVIGVACVEPAYIYGGFGIQRFYTPLILLIVLYFAGMGYLIGCKYKEQLQSKWFSVATISGLAVMSGVMLTNIAIDFPIAKQYAKAVDTRKEYLLKMQEEGYTGTLEIDRIECPKTIDVKYVVFKIIGKTTSKQSIYYYTDVEEGPNDYSTFVPKAYHLDFEIKPKK